MCLRVQCDRNKDVHFETRDRITRKWIKYRGHGHIGVNLWNPDRSYCLSGVRLVEEWLGYLRKFGACAQNRSCLRIITKFALNFVCLMILCQSDSLLKWMPLKINFEDISLYLKWTMTWQYIASPLWSWGREPIWILLKRQSRSALEERSIQIQDLSWI